MAHPNAVLLALLPLAAGCSFAVRSAEMYRDDTGKALAQRQPQVQACYDEVLKQTPDAQGTVTVTFRVEAETGQLKDPKVDEAKSTAPAPVRDCVVKNLEGVAIYPGDKREGQGTWAWAFQPKPQGT